MFQRMFLMLLFLFIQGCSTQKKQPKHTRFIPKNADITVFFAHLEQLPYFLQSVATSLPEHTGAADLCGNWRRMLQLDLCHTSPWTQAGFDISKPATFFAQDGAWALLLHASKHNNPHASWLETLGSKPGFKLQRQRARDAHGFSSYALIRMVQSTPQTLLHAAYRSDGLWMIAPGAQPDVLTPWLGTSASGMSNLTLKSTLKDGLKPWLALNLKNSWDTQKAHRALRKELAQRGSVYAIGTPSSWIKHLPATNPQAKALRTQLTTQLGHVGARFVHHGPSNTLRVHLCVRHNANEPSSIHTLGSAVGALEPLGGLIAPGILGGVRLSVDPKLLQELLLATLSSKQRKAWRAFNAKMHKEFALDLDDAIVHNIKGHVVIALYGLDASTFAHTKKEHLLGKALSLELTHEAMYIPIKDRKKLGHLLDALTQLTQGKLVRQRLENVVQYAWMVEGDLRWALILDDHHVMIVDSASAFGHAMKFVRNPEPLDKKLALHPIFAQKPQGAFYLDSNNLSKLLPKQKPTRILEWLRSFESMMFITHDAKHGDHTEITLQLKDINIP